MTDAASDGSPLSLPSRRGLLRWGLGGLLVLILFLIALMTTVRGLLDADGLERRLNGAVTAATDGQYRMSVETVEWGLLARSLQMNGVHVRPDSQDTVSEASRRVRVAIPALQLQGIDPWALLWERVLRLDAVRVQRPRLSVRTVENPPSPSREAQGEPQDTSAAAGTLADVLVRTVRVEEGTLRRGPGDGPPRDTLWGLSLRLQDLSLDSVRTTSSGSPYLARRLSEVVIDGYRRRVPGQPYELRLGAGRVSPRDSSLRVEGVEFRPTVADDRFMALHDYRVNRFRTALERVAAEGFEYRRFLRTGALCASSVRMEELTLDVYRDNHRPEHPQDPPPSMPQDWIEQLDRRLRLDTLRLRDSRIRYTKRPEGLPKKGSIWFEDVWASAFNVTNDPERMTAASPAVVKVRSRVNGAGLLRTTFRIPLRAPDLSLSFQGHLGPMDARELNDTFVPLGGVRIESGDVDSLSFRADVEEGVATGSLRGFYRNLEIETLNKKTGSRGLGQRLKTIAVNSLALRSNIRPTEDDNATGTIEHERAPDDTFFKFLWHAVRDGIYSLVGIDRLPR